MIRSSLWYGEWPAGAEEWEQGGRSGNSISGSDEDDGHKELGCW